MLIIVYGAIAEMGLKIRQYLTGCGFQLIEKYNYAPEAPHITARYGERNFVSKTEFFEKTDSLFRYEVGGIKIGFNQQQIADAVCNKTNSLLTLSAKNVSFLSEIKRVYGDEVCLIYTYIDDTALKYIISNLDGITAEEADTRFETGQDIKRCYVKNQSFFDKVLIYGGEETEFNYQSLYSQLDSIIDMRINPTNRRNIIADIFVSCAYNDRALFNEIKAAFGKRGLSVFDDSVFAPGTEWTVAIADAVKNAKIVVPVITNDALSDKWLLSEIEYALECAKNNGTLIAPVFEENISLDKYESIKEQIEFLSCVFIENGIIEDAAEKLADKMQRVLSAEANLKTLSKQVDNYLYLKMYEQAKYWQEAHLNLCHDVYSISNGEYIDFEVLLMSRIKLISILIDMDAYEEALDWVIESLNLLNDDNSYNVLAEQFVLCCAMMGMDECSVRNLVEERLTEIQFWTEQDFIENIVESFKNAVATKEKSKTETDNCSKAEDEKRIAQYGELAITLFEDLIQHEAKELSRHDLILGYERILNYCKHIGLKGDVADRCISRIAELSSYEVSSNTCTGSSATEALKIYLGQALPKSGEYDVFLSYKSEDEVLAKRVYDYLSQSGKEVFFAKETLPRLGESEYEEMIFEAIDKSKHMVLIGSDPDYFKTSWVRDEWSTFNNEIREGRKSGNLILLLSDDIVVDKGRLPGQLRQKEIVKMSEFRNRLLPYLR